MDKKVLSKDPLIISLSDYGNSSISGKEKFAEEIVKLKEEYPGKNFQFIPTSFEGNGLFASYITSMLAVEIWKEGRIRPC